MKTFRIAAKLLALILVLTFVLLPFVGCGSKDTAKGTQDSSTQQASQDGTKATQNSTQTGEKISQEEGSQEEQDVPEKYCTVVVDTDPVTVYTVDLDKVGKTDQGLISVFEYLKENEDFTFETKDSGWGAYLTKVLTIDATKDSHSYIMLLTSVEKDFDVTQQNPPTENYGGTTVVYSGVGASSMEIQSGAVYYITLGTF